MCLLILCRHGETTFNRDGVIQGQLDTPLTNHGKEQATRLGLALHHMKVHVDEVHSSGLERADQTAELVMDHLGPAVPTFTYSALKERNFGVLQGKLGSEVRNGPDYSATWHSTPEGGENYLQVATRLHSYLHDTVLPLLREGVSIAVFSHATPLAALQCEVEGLASNDPRVGTPNAGARIYSFDSISETLTLIEVINP